MPRNKKKPLIKLKRVEKDQDQKLLYQVEEIIKEIKEELQKINYLDPNLKENTQISQRQKGLRDHLLAEVRPLAKIKLKVKIAKIRTTKAFQVKKWKVHMIRYIQIVLSINQPLIIELTDMTKKREREEAAEHQIEEAQDHLKLQTPRSLNPNLELKEHAIRKFQQSGISMMTVLEMLWICTCRILYMKNVLDWN